jgi:hypothetical protein
VKNRLVPLIVLAAAGVCAAAPRESITFPAVDGNGLLNSPANSVRQNVFTGGYSLGKITFSGTLTSVHTRTWRSDARLLVTAPDGSSAVFQPFASGGTFSNLAVSGQMWLAPGTNPAGSWTVRFYEAFDDGGTSAVDARWDLTMTLTDDPPAPPAATDLGMIVEPGRIVAPSSLPSEGLRWYRFELGRAVSQFNGYLDVDTFGSVISAGVGVADNDSETVLFDSAGSVIASNDDSCAGFLSQLSFGVGGRPATLDGDPYDGQDGALAGGVYYLAVGGYPLRFSPYWTVLTVAPRSGSTALRFSLGAPCLADFNGDGSSDFFDYLDFVAAFDAEDLAADFNGDQTVDFFDYLDFAAAFDAGCD